MVRSARERASRTMGALHRSRPWPVLRDGAARLLRTRPRAWDGRFRCKQQRIYKAPLMQTPDAFERRAQFQLWIFSYTIRPRPSKKLLSRLMMRGVAPRPCATLRWARFALPTLRRLRRRDRHLMHLHRHGDRGVIAQEHQHLGDAGAAERRLDLGEL